MNSSIAPFHMAMPVHDLTTALAFYKNHFQCKEGRSASKWVDLDFYGHQVVLHETGNIQKANGYSQVDGKDVPVPHYGVVLPWQIWTDLADRLTKAKVPFVIEPYIRFEGEPGEQATMFLMDPSNNALEFKSFKNMDSLFAK